MGMDFTPYEQHQSDLCYHFSSEKMTSTNMETGEQTVVYDPECADAKRWPNSYFLAEKIYKTHKMHPKKLDAFEKTLTKIVEMVDDSSKKPENPLTDFESTVLQWYMGKLDPNFYYAEENNNRMSKVLDNLEIPEDTV